MAFTSSYTDGLIQQSEYYYGTPEMTPGLSGSFSGSFEGDGSNLTGVGAFPFTGDAQITGSLTISGSFHAFTLDSDNVVLGQGSGLSMEAGANNNVIIGTAVGTSLTTGDNNILIGSGSGGALGANSSNVMIGQNAGGNAAGSVSSNVYVGFEAGREGSTATENVGIGLYALAGGTNNTGDDNTGIGPYAGRLIDNGNRNTFVGYRAGYSVTSGNENVLIGDTPAYNITTGHNNIMIGRTVGSTLQSGNANIFIGSGSLGATTTTSDQLRIGNAPIVTISASLATGDIIFASTASAEYFSTTAGNLSNISASYALTASHALNSGGGGSTFPFTGDAVITGSLVISASATSQSLSVIGSGSTVFDVVGSVGTLFSVEDTLGGMVIDAKDISGLPILQASSSGELYLGKSPQSLYTTAVVSATVVSSTASLCTLSTSSYDGAFFDYTITSASNARAGNIMSVWNGGSITHTETTTTDIGSTSGIAFDVIISQSQAQLVAVTDSTSPNTWKVKTIIRSI